MTSPADKPVIAPKPTDDERAPRQSEGADRGYDDRQEDATADAERRQFEQNAEPAEGDQPPPA